MAKSSGLTKKKVALPVEDNEVEEMDQGPESDDEEEERLLTFPEMGLDNKILHAIASFGWSRPTLIQEKTIPLALEGE